MTFCVIYCLTPETRALPTHRLYKAFVDAPTAWEARMYYLSEFFFHTVEMVRMASRKEIENLEP